MSMASGAFLGIMSGTSLDAVDFAILETDGRAILSFGPVGECKLSDELRERCMDATRAAQDWKRGDPTPAIVDAVSNDVAEFQGSAARAFLNRHGIASADIVAAGFHGQTLLHERPTPSRVGRTIQIGDADLLAERLQMRVVHDFRSNDVTNGGHGAPLAPIYHSALATKSGLEPPIAVLNLGGVGNLTFIDHDRQITAFDAGPANGPIDQWIERAGCGRCDEGGRIALGGVADEARIEGWLTHPYFATFGPKSLDRYEFGPDLVADMSREDGAATLTAFVAACVAHACLQAALAPRALVVCGGGRHNQAIMAELRSRVNAHVLAAEEVGWRGDSIEAEAWAFLAARSLNGLPISFPSTTGVNAPLSGGRIALPGFYRPASDLSGDLWRGRAPAEQSHDV